MQSAPLAIPGLPGPVIVDVNEWTGKRRLFVGGHEVPTTRGRFQFPAPDGQLIPGRIKPMRIWETHPKLEFGNVTHATGPEAPTWMKVLACLPILLIGGGALGAVLGVLAIVANLTVIRSGAPRAAVVAISLGTLLSGAAILVIVWLVATGALSL